MAQQNTTVDDTNPAIIYSPPGAWTLSANSSLDIGGAHMLTQTPNATASFTFTGVAIYFLSPKWPYLVNTAVSLDNGPVTLIDLVDHSRPDVGQGPETVQSAVVWNATGLTNTSHTLVMSIGAGQPFGIVDALIFTTLSFSNDTSTTASSLPSASSTTPLATSDSTSSTIFSSATTSSDPNAVVTAPIASDTSSGIVGASTKKTPVAQIAIGSLFGFILLIALIFTLIYYCKRRNRPKSEAWTVADPDGAAAAGVAGGAAAAASGAAYPFSNRSSHAHAMRPMSEAAVGAGMGASAASLSSSRYAGTLQHGPAPGYYDAPAGQDDAYGGYVVPHTPMTDAQHAQQPSATAITPRYQPGYALSTITERSTPRMGDPSRPELQASPSATSGTTELPYYSPAPSSGTNIAGIGTATGPLHQRNASSSRTPQARWI